VEYVLIYGGAPLLLLEFRLRGVMIGMLWGGALLAWFVTRGVQPAPHHVGQELRALFLRFLVLAPPIVVFAWWFWPESFLSLPRTHIRLWLLIMVLYPLLSVWPQEMLYRALLYVRYEPLFGRGVGFIAASAGAFGFAHVIFLNPIAVIMTAIGGFLFARDYARHRSLRLSCLEHSLYGCLIFTVGLGRFFYTGAAWHHH